jgi:hypothetical protein
MGGAVVAAVFIEPVNRKTHAWVERRFHKALLDIRENVPELMRDTRDSTSLDEFLETVLQRLLTGVLSVRGAVILDDEVKQAIGTTNADVLRWKNKYDPKFDRNVLDCVPEDHEFPLRLEVETSAESFGWLLIGPRPDGSIPGEDEQEALEKIAGTLGRSVRIVLSREEERQHMMKLIEDQGERLARIEKALKLKS